MLRTMRRSTGVFGSLEPVEIFAPKELLKEDVIIHFGSPPWRVDILTSVPGVDFEQAYESRVPLPLDEYTAQCISKEWLIKSKRASGRTQDLLDLQSLEAGETEQTDID